MNRYLAFVGRIAPHLDADLVRDLRAVEHGQWETHFEAALLTLMRLPRAEVPVSMAEIAALAEEAGTAHEGVLDPDIWPRVLAWEASRR